MFKAKNGIASPLLKEVFQIASLNYNLWNKREFKWHHAKTVSFGTESLGPKILDKLPNYLKSLISLDKFKKNI